LDQLRAARVMEGSVGDATFTIRYGLEGVGRESSTFRVSGRVLDGAHGRLVLLKYERRPHPLMSVALASLAGVSVLFAQRGIGKLLDPVPLTTAIAAIAAGVVLPRLGAVPSSLVHGVGNQLASLLLGKIE
jgi:hypothetical protein